MIWMIWIIHFLSSKIVYIIIYHFLKKQFLDDLDELIMKIWWGRKIFGGWDFRPVHFWIQPWWRWRKLRPTLGDGLSTKHDEWEPRNPWRGNFSNHLPLSSNLAWQLKTCFGILGREDHRWFSGFDSWKVGCVHTLSTFPPKKEWFIGVYRGKSHENGWFGDAPC